jgi:hypothetical protein
MGIVRLCEPTRNALADSLGITVDAGGQTATIALYAAPMPDDADSPVSSQALLVETSFTYPCAGPAEGGEIILTGKSDAKRLAVGTGRATWARIFDSDGVPVLDVDVGTVGSGAVIQMDDPTFRKGGSPLDLKTMTLGWPSAGGRRP